MAIDLDRQRLEAALHKTRTALLAERNVAGHWTGELSSSALSTATAVCALQIVQRERGPDARLQSLIDGGLQWLVKNQNADGGWGDTDLSFSNISTTTLGWAAFGVVPGADERHAATVQQAEKWLSDHARGLEVDQLADAIIARYGKDRTFSVPILTMCALSGRLGEGAEAWRRVIPLPFELAALPQSWFAALRLPVVSYALPALIAIGQARHRHAPSRNPIVRQIRNAAMQRTLAVLERIQPGNGGFLEATPLTSFVTMSLAGSGLTDHPVVKKGVAFLIASARTDGSWAIDTNLATWVTTLSVNALANDPSFQLPSGERSAIREWLLGQQYRTVHPYTNAAPGGWAWTDLPGGVPDADDTAGALLALKNLGDVDDRVREAAALGVKWLLDLQNRDGGIPTFCRGWTNLPFDRSGSDLTAHAIRAWLAWRDELAATLHPRINRAIVDSGHHLFRGTAFEWKPLWFGNQHWPDEDNVLYGTAKAIWAYSTLLGHTGSNVPLMGLKNSGRQDAVNSRVWTLQHKDGAFGGPNNDNASVEETCLALESMIALYQTSTTSMPKTETERLKERIFLSARWITERVESDTWTRPAPIGFYFAKLWYYEKLYPLIFTVGALSKVKAVLDSEGR